MRTDASIAVASTGILQSAQYMPALSRKTTDPLPPTGTKATGLLHLREGMWCLRQDFWVTENIYVNSHIVRLQNGGLLIVSPPARTEEAEALLNTLPGGCGAVEHVVLPSLSPEHWLHAAGWADRFAPRATLWTAPGLLEARAAAGLLGGAERVRQLRAAYEGDNNSNNSNSNSATNTNFDMSSGSSSSSNPINSSSSGGGGSGRVRVLPEFGPLPGLEGQVEAATFAEGWGLFTECALLLAGPGAVCFSDMAFGIWEHPVRPVIGEQLGKLAGIYRRLGAPVAAPLLRKDPQRGRAWLSRLLGWEFAWVLPGHLDPLVGPDGKRLVREAFGFLLE